MSEEANREATRTSNIALYIAIAALNCRCVSNHRFDLAAWQVTTIVRSPRRLTLLIQLEYLSL